jgi:hypothetical protein
LGLRSGGTFGRFFRHSLPSWLPLFGYLIYGSQWSLPNPVPPRTALFCDLRGFTGFSESADPEDVMVLLRDYQAAIGNGTLERYAGGRRDGDI